jgi:hypothetical protein
MLLPGKGPAERNFRIGDLLPHVALWAPTGKAVNGAKAISDAACFPEAPGPRTQARGCRAAARVIDAAYRDGEQ